MFFELESNEDLDVKQNLINIHSDALCNKNFRKEIWTGEHLQVTLMSIPVGGEIGLEMHDNLEQFIKVEGGCANVYMGATKQDVKLIGKINSHYAVIIPSGMWHNVINTSCCPLKVYSVYAPPKHPIDTVHKTKLDSDLSEE